MRRGSSAAKPKVLISFMVGDLKDKLEPIGRLDALDGVGRRSSLITRKQDTQRCPNRR